MLNVINFWTKFGKKLDCTLRLQLHSIYIYIYMDVNCDKSPLDYIFFLYPLYLQNFKKNKKSIPISSIKSLNFEFL